MINVWPETNPDDRACMSAGFRRQREYEIHPFHVWPAGDESCVTANGGKYNLHPVPSLCKRKHYRRVPEWVSNQWSASTAVIVIVDQINRETRIRDGLTDTVAARSQIPGPVRILTRPSRPLPTSNTIEFMIDTSSAKEYLLSLQIEVLSLGTLCKDLVFVDTWPKHVVRLLIPRSFLWTERLYNQFVWCLTGKEKPLAFLMVAGILTSMVSIIHS